MIRHLLSLKDFSNLEIKFLIEKAEIIKAHPEAYTDFLTQKTLLMIFAKPSLRTRVSFETGMTQLGGHGIYYDIATSPMGKKETIADTAATASRYVDIVMARLFEHKDLVEYAQHSSVPVINALTNFSHPCQILSDLLSIKEKKDKLLGLKLAYFGDANNNVTHSLLYACSKLGINISIACPEGEAYSPLPEVVADAELAAKELGSMVEIVHDAQEAVKNADIVYTDSWMSYHIPEEEKDARVKLFMPFQVNESLMEQASPSAIFMNCLPAQRGMEQTAEVIDGKQSIVFDQAENRLHMQKAIMLYLLDKL